jgi:hypothetical protein
MPTLAQVQAAAVAGVRVWSGYLATRWPVGLYAIWSRDAFERARQAGGTPIAFCSGQDDPIACRDLAARWNVRLCLDVEAGIRDDGPWVQSWLDQSGAGLYGNWWIHTNRRAAFHILAAYPSSGDPSATWWQATARPSGPCGWQWRGSHSFAGIDVDNCWLDDWFAGEVKEEPMHPSVKNTLVRLVYHRCYGNEIPSIALRDAWAALLKDDGSNVEDFYVMMAAKASATGATPP